MTTFHIITAGCSLNSADSEQMAGLLKEAQFKLVDDLEEADIIIFNTCTVKGPTETNFFKELKDVEEKHPYKIIIIAGCIAQTNQDKLKQYPLIGTKQIHNIVEVVEEALNDNVIKMLKMEDIPPLNLPFVRKNPIIEIVPISRGCLGACSFCKTKHARGNLISYPIEEIAARVKKAVYQGVKEIWLTSQDTGCYGFDIKTNDPNDIGTNLPTLLNKLVKIPGQFKIRVGMMNPDHLSKHPKIQDELIEVFQHEKIFKFLHLPVQSGNDEIIKKMNRNYTANDFKKQLYFFRKAIPEINIMTDIIVGFPGETEEQHWDTLTLVRELSPDSINISKFWKRPKTKAAEMKQVSGDVIKKRSNVLTDIFHNISLIRNEMWSKWEGEIIIDEKGKDNQWIGRNEAYKQVIVEGDFKLGDIIKVKIVKAGRFDLRGEVIN